MSDRRAVFRFFGVSLLEGFLRMLSERQSSVMQHVFSSTFLIGFSARNCVASSRAPVPQLFLGVPLWDSANILR